MYRIYTYIFFCFLLSFEGNTQVSNKCSLDYKLFLSATSKGKDQWICGVILSTKDSTNKVISSRFDILKNWKPIDSLEMVLELDTTQLYKKMLRDDEIEMLRYFSSSSGLEIFLQDPAFYEYETSNEMKLTSCQYNVALVSFHRKWHKHQKKFDVFFEK